MNPNHRRYSGYTLMELMVTVAIVILVAGVIIASMPGMIRASKRKETEALIARLEDGLSAYFRDYGFYPIHPNPPIAGEGYYGDSVAREGSLILYRALSGDGNMDGKVDRGATVYVRDLPSAETGKGIAAVDSFGAPLRYLAAPPGVNLRDKRTRNLSFDLWSVGGSDDPEDSPGWLTR